MEASEIPNLSHERWSYWSSGAPFLLFSAFQFIRCEQRIISALWLKPAHHYTVSQLLFAPIFVIVPFLMGASFQWGMQTVFRKGQLSRVHAKNLALGVSSFTFAVYLAFFELMDITF